jgi:hypothetical protein
MDKLEATQRLVEMYVGPEIVIRRRNVRSMGSNVTRRGYITTGFLAPRKTWNSLAEICRWAMRRWEVGATCS